MSQEVNKNEKHDAQATEAAWCLRGPFLMFLAMAVKTREAAPLGKDLPITDRHLQSTF